MMESFAAVHESGSGPFQPRRLSACVSAIGGLAAARGVLSANDPTATFGPIGV
jgi:hypothetical protein